MKKILLIIASEGFQPKEYQDTKDELEKAGFEVITASDRGGMATGSDGSTAMVDITLEHVQAVNYDGIFFIGGSGALLHLDNQKSNQILSEAMLYKKYYGAICIAPRILAKAHVMIGARATGWDEDNKLSGIYEENNVLYIKEDVVRDKNIITANGPAAAKKFGETIVNALEE